MPKEETPSTAIHHLDYEIINLTTLTVSRLLELGGGDAAALYLFYVHTAKLQSHACQENIVNVKATDTYCMTGLRWGREKFYRVKEVLVKSGIIEVVERRDDSGKITGHYVHINYLLNYQDSSHSTQNQSVDKPECGFQDTNTINKNINTRNKKRNTCKKVGLTNQKNKKAEKNTLSNIPTNGAQKSLVACTEEELYYIAVHDNISLDNIRNKHRQIMEMIESGEFQTKYKKHKTVFDTLRKWLRMAVEKGYIEKMTDLERLDLPNQEPAEVRRREAAIRILEQHGEL